MTGPLAPKRVPLDDAARQHLAQGQRHESKAEFDEAIAAFRRALALQPDSGLVHAMIGGALHSKGDTDGAIESLRKALALDPELAEAHNETGLVHEARGEADQAIACFRRAVDIKPELFAARMNLGRALQLRGDHGPAAEAYRKVLIQSPDYHQAHHNLGVALEALGRLPEATDCYRQALRLNPHHLASQIGLVRLLSQIVPTWHVPMMNDARRNDAYVRALRAVVSPESVVFEIGTGSGLLSLMAAKLGARRVVTCEAEPVVAAAAERVVAENGLGHAIRVVPKRSTEVALGADLPQRADILLQEVFSSELLSEGVLASVADAKRRLLADGCTMIPAAASIMVALFGGDEIEGNLFVDEIGGLKLRSFNDIVPKRRLLYRNDLALDLLSDPAEAFRFDFANELRWVAAHHTMKLRVRQSGRCFGIVQWIKLSFDEENSFENHPGIKTPATSWPPCLYLNPSPVAVAEGRSATVLAAHDTLLPFFWLLSVE